MFPEPETREGACLSWNEGGRGWSEPGRGEGEGGGLGLDGATQSEPSGQLAGWAAGMGCGCGLGIGRPLPWPQLAAGRPWSFCPPAGQAQQFWTSPISPAFTPLIINCFQPHQALVKQQLNMEVHPLPSSLPPGSYAAAVRSSLASDSPEVRAPLVVIAPQPVPSPAAPTQTQTSPGPNSLPPFPLPLPPSGGTPMSRDGRLPVAGWPDLAPVSIRLEPARALGLRGPSGGALKVWGKVGVEGGARERCGVGRLEVGHALTRRVELNCFILMFVLVF